MGKIIEMKNMGMKYDKKRVLDNINCIISEKEIFGLIGPSGAGKTTMISILTGQAKKTSGEAIVLGMDTDHYPEDAYASFGMVLDTLGLFEMLTCYQNLDIYAEIHRVGKEKIPIVLEKVNLLSELKTKVFQLSKGMRQRLAIARAVLHEPRLLFLDEPTSGLDPGNTLEIHKLILSLREQGATIFLTTHRMDEAMKLCDNIMLLDKGIVMEYGRPDLICQKYNLCNHITLTMKDGSTILVPNNSESSEVIARYMQEGNVVAIHSSEPDLERVFLSITTGSREACTEVQDV